MQCANLAQNTVGGTAGFGCAALGVMTSGALLEDGRLGGSLVAWLAAVQLGSDTVEAAWAEDSPRRRLGDVNGGNRPGPAIG